LVGGAARPTDELEQIFAHHLEGSPLGWWLSQGLYFRIGCREQLRTFVCLVANQPEGAGARALPKDEALLHLSFAYPTPARFVGDSALLSG
jgi:hypothetical protein